MTNSYRRQTGAETSRIRKLIPDPPASRIPPIQGTLGEYPLAEMLQFLQQTRRTGRLALERGDPAQVATILVHDGRAVEARCPPQLGNEALLTLLGWRHGRFLFLSGAVPEGGSVTWPLSALLLESARRWDDLQRALTPLPPLDWTLHRVHNTRLASHPLSRRAWNLLTQIDGQRTLDELLEGFNCPAIAVAQAVGELLEAGLVANRADTEFLDDLVVRRRIEPLGDHPAADLVLGLADGQRSLHQIAVEGGLATEDLIACVITLVEEHALDIVRGESVYLERLAPEIPARLL